MEEPVPIRVAGIAHMHAHTPAIDEPSAAPGSPVKVWDGFIRLFHWTLVAGFATAFISGETGAEELHAWTGYALGLLLCGRIYWGFAGSRHARFRDFLFAPQETLAYVRSLRTGHPRHYLGHNPAGALMVFALLGLLLLLLLSGLVTLAVIDFDGPLRFLATRLSDDASYAVQAGHECLPYLGLGLVALHLAGVVSGSLQHRENLLRAMITGYKSVPPPSFTQHKEPQ
jgi:cytochrome b